MSENTNPDAAKKDTKAPELTAAKAASMVTRPVPKTDKDGKAVLDEYGVQVIVQAKIRADEVLGFRDHGTHVTVVTVDGRKFRSDGRAD